MQQSPSWEGNRFSASLEIPRILWNPKVHYRSHKCPYLSLSCARSIQCIPPHPTSWRSILILSSHLCLGLLSDLLPSDFPTKTLYTPLPSPYALHAPPISFFSILSSEQYLVNGTDHRAHYTVPSVPLLPRSSQAQIPSSASYSRTPYAYVPPSMWQTKFHTHMNQQEKL